MARLTRIVRTKNLLQMRFEYALWTLAMIRELIRREFGVKLSEVSVGRLMKRLCFTPQRPLYRARQQDPALVEHWQHTKYPKLAARAKRENDLIFFTDESSIRSGDDAGTTWATKGKTPVVEVTGARFSLNMLSADSANAIPNLNGSREQAMTRVNAWKKSFNQTWFVDFLGLWDAPRASKVIV